MTARRVWLFTSDNRMDDGRKHESKHCMRLFVQICVDTQRISCGGRSSVSSTHPQILSVLQ